MSFYNEENSDTRPIKRRRSASPQPSSLGWIVAHEATLLRGHDALAALTEAHGGHLQGGRMVQWVDGTVGEDEERIYVDRYDALNLLTTLPVRHPSPQFAPSPCSDIPSDSEELYYLTPLEIIDLERTRSRAVQESARLSRLAALRSPSPIPDPLVPPQEQMALMQQLRKTLDRSKEPGLLEMRILANHGADDRFGFLRKGGRWRAYWEELERVQEVEVHVIPIGGLGALGGYGSSDESEDDEEDAAPVAVSTQATAAVPEPTGVSLLALKQAKLLEWSRKRKLARDEAEAASPDPPLVP